MRQGMNSLTLTLTLTLTRRHRRRRGTVCIRGALPLTLTLTLALTLTLSRRPRRRGKDRIPALPLTITLTLILTLTLRRRSRRRGKGLFPALPRAAYTAHNLPGASDLNMEATNLPSLPGMGINHCPKLATNLCALSLAVTSDHTLEPGFSGPLRCNRWQAFLSRHTGGRTLDRPRRRAASATLTLTLTLTSASLGVRAGRSLTGRTLTARSRAARSPGGGRARRAVTSEQARSPT